MSPVAEKSVQNGTLITLLYQKTIGTKWIMAFLLMCRGRLPMTHDNYKNAEEEDVCCTVLNS
jgi:hypothetical protein